MLEKWVWKFEKGEEEDLEKEERTRKLENVESRLKKEKKRFGERRKKVHMDFYVHLSFATLRTRVLKTRIPSKNSSTSGSR